MLANSETFGLLLLLLGCLCGQLMLLPPRRSRYERWREVNWLLLGHFLAWCYWLGATWPLGIFSIGWLIRHLAPSLLRRFVLLVLQTSLVALAWQQVGQGATLVSLLLLLVAALGLLWSAWPLLRPASTPSLDRAWPAPSRSKDKK